MSRPPIPSGKPDVSHWDFPEDRRGTDLHRSLADRMEGAFAAVLADKFGPRDLDALAAAALEAFAEDAWGLFRVFLEGRDLGPSTEAASLHTALVLYLLARSEGLPEAETTGLVRAALVHDVGMLYLPRGLVDKEGRLSDQERALLENHPWTSHERVKQWGEAWESTQMALQHHEQWSGGGYPSGLVGEAIHPWARKAAVAVNFAARITQRSYRTSLVGYEAVRLLVQDQAQRFDPAVVKSFVRAFGLNPPGGIVLLGDGSVARVHEVTSAGPLRPRVRVLIDALGHPYRDDRGPLLDLGGLPKLFIARPVNLQDLLEARGQQIPG